MLWAQNSLPLIEMQWLCNGGVSLYQTAGLGTKNAEQNVSARWDCINLLCRVPMHGKNARLLDDMATLLDLGHLRFYYGQVYDPQPHTTHSHIRPTATYDPQPHTTHSHIRRPNVYYGLLYMAPTTVCLRYAKD
jgi:hypothetical protein